MTHPAQFTPSVIDTIERILVEFRTSPRNRKHRRFRVFDPCAGAGWRLADLCAKHGWEFTGVDIEQWDDAHPNVIQWDSTDLSRVLFPSSEFSAVVTSITYANGLADKGLNMADPHGRRTYDIALGRPLHPNNTGRYGLRQGKVAYKEYLRLHGLIYRECHRITKPGGIFLLNVSDVIQNHRPQPITMDNVTLAERAGWRYQSSERVMTPRYGYGANASARVPGEDVVVLRKATNHGS